MKPHLFDQNLAALSAVSLAMTGLLSASLTTTNLLYHWDASDAATATAADWTSKEGSQAGTFDVWAVQPGVTQVADTSAAAGIAQAYQFGTWAPDSSDGSLTRVEFGDQNDSGLGAAAQITTSVELWIKPDNLTSGREMIFETGGSTRGFQLALDDDELLFVAKAGAGGPGATAAPTEIITHTLSAADIADYIQVVMTVDANTDTMELYVNPLGAATPGTPVATNSWAGVGDHIFGTGDAALGGIFAPDAGGSDIGGGGPNAAPWRVDDYFGFLGRIALMRVYNVVLTGTEVSDNFTATFTGPAILTNAPLKAEANSSGTVITDEAHLLTGDSDTGAAGLTYTLTSLPAAATLHINGAAAVLGSNDTFTQDDVNNDLITVDGGASTVLGDTFAFDVSDGTCTVSGTFTINVAIAGGAVVDTFTSDEDSVVTDADLANLLENDTGDPISIVQVNGNAAGVGSEVITALGASLIVNADGTFSYDPTGAAGLQAGGGADSFTYTIEDLFGGTSTETVSITVTSVNDLPDAVNDLQVGSIFEDGSLVSTLALTANDGIVRTDVDSNDILSFNLDARYGAGATVWENRGSSGGAQADALLGTGVTIDGSPGSAFAQITSAYKFDGTTDATAQLRGGAPETINGSDTSSASFEVWVKLDAADLGQVATLFETGGGSGVGMVVDNGVVVAATDTNGAPISYDLIADARDLINPGNQNGAADVTGEFIQVVYAIELSGGNLNKTLYVNGAQVGAASRADNDWSGSDGAALGHFAGVNHGGFANPAAGTVYDTHLNGHLFAFRQYDGALNRTQVLQNFVAISSGTDVDGESITVNGILDGTATLRGVGVAATLASGAIVTLDNNTGSFTYDPNGSFESLVAGDSGVESFTCEVGDGAGGAGTADVTFTIRGKNDAMSDTIAVRETEVTTFGINALVGNDEHTLPTPTPYLEFDLLNASGGTITGTGSAASDATILSGTVLTPPDVSSNFGALGAAIENPNVSFASLDSISTGDVTFEVWFKPDTGTTGRQLLVESGGNGNGTSIVYDANLNEVVITIDGGTDGDAGLQLAASVGGVVMAEFNQFVAVLDLNNPGVEDSVSLYLNNDPAAFNGSTTVVTNAIGGLADWCGADLSGIGAISGTAARNESPGPFAGRIAIVRVYDRTLDASEVEANFDVEADKITGLVTGSPVVTALGATVTLNPDGTFTYDTTTLSSDVLNGAVVQDSFQYAIDDGNGGSSEATVTVNVAGVDNTFYAVDDSVNIGEDDSPMSFDPLANDVGAGAATIEFPTVVDSASTVLATLGVNPGDPADFTSGGFGWRFLWNAPSDWNGTSSVSAVDGALGSVADYELLTWSGTAWRPDADDDTSTGDPGGFLRFATTGGHPGLGSGSPGTTPADNNQDRAVIMAYTVPTTDIHGIANSSLGRAATSAGSVSANVYVDSTLIDTVTCGPGQTVGFDMNIGSVTMGSTIYIAISPDGAAGSDTFTLDFDLVTLPSLDTPVDNLTGFSTDGSTITYDPAGGFGSLALNGSATRTISYTIVDGGKTSVGTFTVTIDGANDAPTPADDVASTDEDSNAIGDVLANDTDPDQADTTSLVVSAVDAVSGNVGMPAATMGGGMITLNADGSFTYTPAPSTQALKIGESVVDTITYSIADQHGLAGTANGILTITVTGSEDGVVATNDSFTVAPDGMLTGNLIVDDNGNGADSTIDLGDDLAILSVDTTGLEGTLTLDLPGVIAARGTVDLTDDTPVSVSFGAGIFTNPVVIVGPVSNNEPEPCVVQVTSVNAAGGFFNIELKEQPEAGAVASDGDAALHVAETISWMVVEAGQYQLSNGALVEAGTVTTAAIQEDAAAATWESVTFATTFTQTPVVMTSLNSVNPLAMAGETTELMGTRQQNTTTTGFEVAMEDHEGDITPRVTTEVIGWLAIEPGLGGWSGNPFEVGVTPDSVVENFFTINLWRSFGSAPNFFAKMARIDGVDPSHVRYQNLGADSVQVKIGEDRYSDTELGHTAEIVGYLAIGGTNDLTAYDQGTVPGAFTYDATGASGVQTFSYTLTDNLGASDTGTVTITIGGAATDTDMDGIPDSVEDATAGLDRNNPDDALEDQDGDGASAIFEYGMGTGINDPNDTPIFFVERFDETQNKITIGPIKAGRTYLLFEGDSLPLTQVDSFTASADAATHEFFRTRVLSAALYQIEVDLPATGGGDTDTDMDGIPDSVENATAGLDANNPDDAVEDQDGDGASAIWEYGMGTDLNDRNDKPTFLVEPFDATQNRITLGPITAGRTYLLYEGTSLPLTQVDSFTAGADAATHEFFRPRTGSVMLYRAEVVLPLP